MRENIMVTNVAILGASENPERYANKAQIRLTEHGYHVLPVSPTGKTVLGTAGFKSLQAIQEPVDTVTIYVGPKNLRPQLGDMLALKPRRVIFNPGTEDADLQLQLEGAGIHVVEACTLVLLSIGQFDTA
jgi:predicted CoA-binding protein